MAPNRDDVTVIVAPLVVRQTSVTRIANGKITLSREITR